MAQGKHAEAESVCGEILTLTVERRAGAATRGHMQTFKTPNNLALALKSQGKLANAKDVFSGGFFNGLEHPDTLTTWRACQSRDDAQVLLLRRWVVSSSWSPVALVDHLQLEVVRLSLMSLLLLMLLLVLCVVLLLPLFILFGLLWLDHKSGQEIYTDFLVSADLCWMSSKIAHVLVVGPLPLHRHKIKSGGCHCYVTFQCSCCMHAPSPQRHHLIITAITIWHNNASIIRKHISLCATARSGVC
jgi:hypothetical protein